MVLIRILRDSLNLIKYATPNLFHPSVEISDQGKLHLKELRTNGITKIHSIELENLANHLEKEYFPRIPRGKSFSEEFHLEKGSPLFIHQLLNKKHYIEGGTTISAKISMRDVGLEPI